MTDIGDAKVVHLKPVEAPAADAGVQEVLDMFTKHNDKGEIRSIFVTAICKNNDILKAFHFAEGESRAMIIGSVELIKEFFIRNTDYLNTEIE